MKTCSVIVTYGDRFHLLKKVIGACFKEGIYSVIVIDNASVENSRNQLKKYEQKYNDKVKVIYLDENTGSAGGYKRGLEEAYKCEECEYIWLLDDDNEPQKDSLKVLKEFWNNLEEDDNKKEKVALLSFRPDRQRYKEAVAISNPKLVLNIENSFFGFHIKDIFNKIIRLNMRLLNIKRYNQFETNKKSGEVFVAPYGGLFFNKNIITNIKYPDENFFVYADDHEWSYRIIKNHGKIYLVLDSKIEDIEKSWNNDNKYKTIFSSLANADLFRLYYGIRNKTFFEINFLVSNKTIYKINLIIFKMIFYFFTLNKKHQKNYKVFNIAINDAINNKMGKKDIF